MVSQPLILVFCYFVLILVILPSFCSDKVYSMFYQADAITNREINIAKNEHRKHGVLDYLNKLDIQESLSYHEAKLTEVIDNLIIVIAKHPSHKNDLVLSQLVTEVDRNIRSEHVYKSAMIICNATRIPFSELSVLSRFYVIEQIQNTTTWKMFNKEEVIKHDFVDCISMAVNKTKAKHVTVIRDKVIPYSGFLQSLNHVVSSQLSSHIRRGELHERESSWLFLHLQEPVPHRHYSFSFNSFKELLIIASAGSLIFYYYFLWWEGRPNPSFPGYTYIFLGALYFITFALVIGRPYVSEIRRTAGALYRVYDPLEPVHFSAISLPSCSINELLLQLNRLHCSNYMPFHEVLDHMINTLEKPAFVISPSLVRYVVKV